MEKEFIPYELALRMKQLGFDGPSFGVYIAGHLMITYDSIYNSTDIPVVKAPTFSQAFRFFRERYNVQSSVKFTHAKYSFEIHFEKLANGENPPVMVWHFVDSWLGLNLSLFETYEETELTCLNKLIEIVEQNQQ